MSARLRRPDGTGTSPNGAHPKKSHRCCPHTHSQIPGMTTQPCLNDSDYGGEFGEQTLPHLESACNTYPAVAGWFMEVAGAIAEHICTQLGSASAMNLLEGAASITMAASWGMLTSPSAPRTTLAGSPKRPGTDSCAHTP